MISADWRRIRRRARRLARPRLHYLLHWAAWHALAGSGVRGMRLDDEATHAAAATAIHRVIDELADGGAFRYFGITNAWDLGPVPISLRIVTADGGVALEVEPIAEVILDGGRRGVGWMTTEELSVDDLAR